jgi:hypothetical protein
MLSWGRFLKEAGSVTWLAEVWAAYDARTLLVISHKLRSKELSHERKTIPDGSVSWAGNRGRTGRPLNRDGPITNRPDPEGTPTNLPHKCFGINAMVQGFWEAPAPTDVDVHRGGNSRAHLAAH